MAHPVDTKAQRIWGPNGIPIKVQNVMSKYHNRTAGTTGNTNQLFLDTFDGTSDIITLLLAHAVTPQQNILIGHNHPFQFWNANAGAPDSVEFPGIDELAAIWPNQTVKAMKVDFILTAGKVDFQIPGRYLFCFRWLRADDIPQASWTTEQIQEDETWTRIPLNRLDSATEISSREAKNATSFYISCFKKWSKLYRYEEDDEFTEGRITAAATLPLKPLILEFQVFNSDGVESWVNNTWELKAETTLYYEHDRITGTEVFIEA